MSEKIGITREDIYKAIAENKAVEELQMLQEGHNNMAFIHPIWEWEEEAMLKAD